MASASRRKRCTSVEEAQAPLSSIFTAKTEHQDGGERWVPLFPELLPFLEEAFELAAAGAVHVITRWRDSEKNLRTGLYRILRRAGVKPWPRLYQNLRSSRETELADTFPIHVVAEWLGNSPKTALAHYTQVTEEHYQKAVQNPVQLVQKMVQHEADAGSHGVANPQENQEIANLCLAHASRCELPLTPTGFEPVSRP
jgi:hypothetical protein